MVDPDGAGLIPLYWDRGIWIEITGVSSGRYSWAQTDETSTSFPSLGTLNPFSLSGTTTATGWPAYEVNGRTDVPTGAKVKAFPSTSGQWWVFQYGDRAGAAAVTDDGGVNISSSASPFTAASVTTTAAGVHLIVGQLTGWLNVSSFGTSPTASITAALSGSLANTQAFMCFVTPANPENVETATLVGVTTTSVAAGTTFDLTALRQTLSGGGTYTNSEILQSRLVAVRIGS